MPPAPASFGTVIFIQDRADDFILAAVAERFSLDIIIEGKMERFIQSPNE